MLLDYVYTDRYNCQAQYDAIVQYCSENNYLVHPKSQLQQLTNMVSANQFVHSILIVILTLMSQKKYTLANEMAVALKNDLTTKI